MMFIRYMAYHPIAVLVGLVTVILTYNVEQCDPTIQRRLDNSCSHDSLEWMKWVKWARLFSFCKSLYYDNVNLRYYDYHCSTRDCKECLTVCLMDSKIRNVMSLCKQNCTTDSCKKGCGFYYGVFIVSYIRDVSIPDMNWNTEPKTKKDKRIVVNVGSNMNEIDLSWQHVLPDHNVIPSLYLITLATDRRKDIITLTETNRYLVEIKDMCRNISSTSPYEVNLKFSFHVVPINWIDRGKHENIFIFRPVEPPIGVSVSQPLFEKSVIDKVDFIVWEIEWKKLSNINEGFRIMYGIYSCSVSTNFIEMKKLNPKKVHFVKEGLFRIRIANTKDDKLDTCKIFLELRTRQRECFFGKPYNTILKYSGCQTISGYPHPCEDTLIYDFTTTISAADCVNPSINPCPENENITCEYCETTNHKIKVKWDHPTNVMNINGYTVRWGELMIRGKSIDPLMDRTASIPKSDTSFIIDFFANERLYIGIQVHAETFKSKPRWQSNVNSIQNVTLEPLEPKPLSPTKDDIISPTIIIVIIVLILTVSCSLTLYITYRRHLNLREKVKRNEIKMKEQERGAVDRWEIPCSILFIDKKIGEGAFGNVYCAFIKTSELRKTPYADQCSRAKLMRKKTKVAVKFLKDDALETEHKDFNEEITLMKHTGFHQNIVNIIGCSNSTTPPYLVLEYMNGGDLLNYMRVFRKYKISMAAVAGTGDDSTKNVDHLSQRDVMSFSWQIACGMEYLSINNIVHRDLAARNILISNDKKIKISDFGLSRFVSDELIYLSHNKNRKIPIKWMSTEAIYRQEFTTASDVWAYGVVLFEMVTLGGTPYPSIGNRELGKMLKSGYRMDKPDNCEDTVYDIMLHCWDEIPTKRPTFTELREYLEELIEKDETYFSFNINENDLYYKVASFRSIPSDVNDDGDDAFKLTNELLKLLNRTRTTTI